MKLTKRNNRFYLRKTIDGKPREISLGDCSKTAKTKAARFLLTLEANGFETAMAELGGKSPVKKGTDLDFDGVKSLYDDFLAQADKQQVRENTKNINLNNLKRCMEACGGKLSKLNAKMIREKLLPDNPTSAQKRSFATIIRTARSIFKKSALRYYETRGFKMNNPFAEFEIDSPKVETFTPIPQTVIESIWKDCEEELDSVGAIIVLLALGAGLRRSEIRAARLSWFSIQSEKVLISIQEESDYIPKTGEKRVIPISLELWKRIENLNNKSERLIPHDPKKKFEGDIHFEKVNEWLKGKGIAARTPLHSLRKQAGSILAKNHGILEASRFLGHSEVTTTARHYAGVELKNPVQVIEQEKDPLESLAKSYGISVDELKKFLASQKPGN